MNDDRLAVYEVTNPRTRRGNDYRQVRQYALERATAVFVASFGTLILCEGLALWYLGQLQTYGGRILSFDIMLLNTVTSAVAASFTFVLFSGKAWDDAQAAKLTPQRERYEYVTENTAATHSGDSGAYLTVNGEPTRKRRDGAQVGTFWFDGSLLDDLANLEEGPNRKRLSMTGNNYNDMVRQLFNAGYVSQHGRNYRWTADGREWVEAAGL